MQTFNEPVKIHRLIDERYKDLDLRLPFHPLKGDLTPIKGKNAVIESVKRLVMMKKWDVPFHPEITARLDELLFENFGSVEMAHYQTVIKDTLERYEPRIDIKEIKLSQVEQLLNVDITFEIISLEETVTTRIIMKRER